MFERAAEKMAFAVRLTKTLECVRKSMPSGLTRRCEGLFTARRTPKHKRETPAFESI